MPQGYHRVEYRQALFSLGREDRVYRPAVESGSFWSRFIHHGEHRRGFFYTGSHEYRAKHEAGRARRVKDRVDKRTDWWS